MVLHVDYLNEQGILGFATTPAKVAANLALLPNFEQGARQQRPKAKTAFAVIDSAGRWVIVYREQVKEPFEKRMYFIDFRYDVEPVIAETFGAQLAGAILSQRTKYDRDYREQNNTVELTLAEAYEVVISPNLFACNVEERVIQKARALGVLSVLEANAGTTGTKACFADEVEGEQEWAVQTLYALFRFHGITHQDKPDEGYVYIKLRDLDRNSDQLDDFFDKVLSSGVQFERSAMRQQFAKNPI